MNFLPKLLTVVILLAPNLSSYADEYIDNELTRHFDITAWYNYMNKYGLQVEISDDSNSNSVGGDQIKVSGYKPCAGVYMLQREVDGKRVDLILTA